MSDFFFEGQAVLKGEALALWNRMNAQLRDSQAKGGASEESNSTQISESAPDNERSKTPQQLAPSQARKHKAATRNACIDAICLSTKEDPLKLTEERWSQIHDAIKKDETNRHLLYRNKHTGKLINVASMKEHYLDQYHATRRGEN
jgi:hypothetical protein